MHGHTYFGEVSVFTDKKVDKFVIDFKELKKIINDNIISLYDHGHLNAYFTFPSVEVLTTSIFESIKNYIKINYGEEIKLERVMLHETQDSYCEVTN